MNFCKKNYLLCINFIILVAFCMLFLNCGTYTGQINNSTPFSGFEMIFGYEVNNIKVFTFNILGFLSIILMISGVVIVNLKSEKFKYYPLIAAIVFIISAIFMMLIKPSLTHSQKMIAKDFKILFPMYLSFSLILSCSIIAILPYILKNKKN